MEEWRYWKYLEQIHKSAVRRIYLSALRSVLNFAPQSGCQKDVQSSSPVDFKMTRWNKSRECRVDNNYLSWVIKLWLETVICWKKKEGVQGCSGKVGRAAVSDRKLLLTDEALNSDRWQPTVSGFLCSSLILMLPKQTAASNAESYISVNPSLHSSFLLPLIFIFSLPSFELLVLFHVPEGERFWITGLIKKVNTDCQPLTQHHADRGGKQRGFWKLRMPNGFYGTLMFGSMLGKRTNSGLLEQHSNWIH